MCHNSVYKREKLVFKTNIKSATGGQYPTTRQTFNYVINIYLVMATTREGRMNGRRKTPERVNKNEMKRTSRRSR